MIILVLLLTVLPVMPASAMLSNYEKEAKIKRVTTQTIVKKIKGGCIGENTDTLLETAKKNDPKNYALQAYIIGKTAHTMSQYKYYSPGETFNEFTRIACRACSAHDEEGQQVAEVMKAYWREKKDPVTYSIANKYHHALRFLIMVKEPLYPSQITAACIAHDARSLQLLLQAGCPPHDNNKKACEQPLVYAAEHAAEKADFTLLKSLIDHDNLKATFKQGEKDVTLAEYFQHRWSHMLERNTREAKVCKFIIDLLTN